MTIYRILYLPMEVAARELDSRLLIASFALSRGFEVVVGQKWLIERNIESMPPGIYLSKTLTSRDASMLSRAKSRGYLVAALDEELPGLVTRSDELRWMSDDAVNATDVLFISGSVNGEAVRQRFPGAVARIKSATNPRWDLLRPEMRAMYAKEAEAISQRFGRFILINTNLGLTNSEKGTATEIIAEQERLGKLSMNDKSHVALVNGILAMEAANRAAVLQLIDTLPKRYPERRIVIRPHPSERLDTWKSSVDGHAVVNVVREGPAIPWIQASDVLVHTNCTTGVEAIALDKPAICMLPSELQVNNRYLANLVNPVAGTVDDTLELIDRANNSTKSTPYYSDRMYATLHEAMSFDKAMTGAELIVNTVETLAQQEGRRLAAPTTHTQWHPSKDYAWNIRDKNVRGILFPLLDSRHIVNRMTDLGHLLALSGTPKIHDCGSKVILLSPHDLPLLTKARSLLSQLPFAN